MRVSKCFLIFFLARFKILFVVFLLRTLSIERVNSKIDYSKVHEFCMVFLKSSEWCDFLKLLLKKNTPCLFFKVLFTT